MPLVAEHGIDSQPESAGSFRSTGLPDWVYDDGISDEEFDRHAAEFDQELAEQQAFAALNDLRNEYGITAMNLVIEKVQSAGKAVMA